MTPTRVPLTVSVPPEMAKEFDRRAKAHGKNRSELFRDMFRAYEQYCKEQQFYELQRYGTRQARKKRILTEADVEKIVFQHR